MMGNFSDIYFFHNLCCYLILKKTVYKTTNTLKVMVQVSSAPLRDFGGPEERELQSSKREVMKLWPSVETVHM